MSKELITMTVREIRDKARDDAEEVLFRHWIPRTLPVQPVPIARALGISVFSAQLGDDAWGMLVGSGAGVDMYLDKDQPPTRFRFSCAHEIGHFVDRGADVRPDQAFIDSRSDSGKGRADEIYANEFAGSLLIPKPELVAAIRAGEGNWDLADRFAVSVNAISYRRHLLGV
jgi:Zn-dependent peptidase ImmA (M78 family)